MKKIITAAALMAGIAAVSMGFTANVEAKGGKCVMAGGEATMVTEDLAKFMSEAALKNSIAAHSWNASGSIKTKCDATNGLPHCVSKRRACA